MLCVWNGQSFRIAGSQTWPKIQLRSGRKTRNNILAVIFYITRVLENKLISLNTRLEGTAVNYSLFLFLTY